MNQTGSDSVHDQSRSTAQANGEQTTTVGPLLPMEDLTAAARSGTLRPALEAVEGLFDHISRVLFRREQNHVVLTGDKGVGKTTILREFARRAAEGQLQFLADYRFIRFDCRHVPAEDSRPCIEAILAALEREPHIVACLDDIASIVKQPGGGTNLPLLCATLAIRKTPVIASMASWEFADLFAGNAQLLENVTRIDVPEPTEAQALEIAAGLVSGIEREFDVAIDPSVPERAVQLSSSFLLSERLPQKAIKTIRRACDEVAFERSRTQSGSNIVTTEHIIRVVAERSGLPKTAVSGSGEETDYQAALTEAVVGQDEAIEAVVTELQLIKSGLTEADKPASVMLFAGMTGVGKTELAKRIAKLYSASKQLHVYTMANFTEPHSVSGIIGVPPGYVGHDQGGRLINELNSDPYSVFLLDEAEKCHPNVWKPFLNLFDEGWIVDQRGVKAHSDRAIFILTSNAGDNAISQMTAQNKPMEEIVEHVKNRLSKIRLERSSQPVFPPQFLSRIKRILVFRPLDKRAMIAIASKMIDAVAGKWMQKRSKQIVVSDDTVRLIGSHAHELNEAARGREGGRLIARMISDHIESPTQEAALRNKDDYERADQIVVNVIAAKEDNSLETLVKFE